MQEQLLIFLNPHALNQPTWMIIGNDQSLTISGDASALSQIAQEKEVIVFIPTEAVTLLTVKLPQVSRSRLIEALPFALEDQLAGDLEHLHFVLGRTQTEDGWPVAVIAKDKMAEFIALFAEWQIAPQQCVPDIFALPYIQEAWHVALYSDRALVRLGASHGFAVSLPHLNVMLSAAYAATKTQPQHITISEITSSCIDLKLSVPTEKRKCDEKNWYQEVGRTFSSAPVINLLQGSYRPKKRMLLETAKLRKSLIALSIVWFSLLVFTPAFSYFILKKKESSLQQTIAALYFSQFPDSKKMTSPKLALEKKLQSLSMTSSSGKLFDLFNDISQSLMQTPQIQLKHVSFQHEQMVLEFEAASSADYTKFTDFLSQNQLQVKEESVSLEGKRINASISMR